MPLTEIVSAERAVIVAENGLRVALKKQRERAAGGTDIYRLPEAIENQYMLIERCAHTDSTGRKLHKRFPHVNETVGQDTPILWV